MNSWNIQHVAGCQWSIRLSSCSLQDSVFEAALELGLMGLLGYIRGLADSSPPAAPEAEHLADHFFHLFTNDY